MLLHRSGAQQFRGWVTGGGFFANLRFRRSLRVGRPQAPLGTGGRPARVPPRGPFVRVAAVARPAKITPEIETKLLELLAIGVTRKIAAAACGICDDTIANHEKRSSGFSEAIKKASAEAICHKIRAIRDAIDGGTWQAAAWWLERRQFEDWGRKDRIDPVDKDGQSSQDGPKWNLDALSTYDLRELYRIQVEATKNSNGTG